MSDTTNTRLLRLIREELRQLSEDAAPFEQCASCSGWFSLEEMEQDEHSHTWVCCNCYPILTLW